MSDFIPNVPLSALVSQLRRLRPGLHDEIHIKRMMSAAAARLEVMEEELERLRNEAAANVLVMEPIEPEPPKVVDRTPGWRGKARKD